VSLEAEPDLLHKARVHHVHLPSIVMDVSAIFVATMIFRKPRPAGRNTFQLPARSG
jgi:hypothetical protein